jgi:hypothetical protein
MNTLRHTTKASSQPMTSAWSCLVVGAGYRSIALQGSKPSFAVRPANFVGDLEGDP